MCHTVDNLGLAPRIGYKFGVQVIEAILGWNINEVITNSGYRNYNNYEY